MSASQTASSKIRPFIFIVMAVCAVITMPKNAAAQEIPEAVKHMLVQSITLDGGVHLPATVKMAAAAVPEERDQILLLMVLYAPNRIGEVKEALGMTLDGSRPVKALSTEKTDPATTAGTQARSGVDPEVEQPAGFFSTRNLAGKLELGGAVNTGNTDDESLVAALSLNRKDGPWTYSLKSGFELQRRDNETTQQRFVIDTAINYDITQRLYTYGTAGYEDDAFSGFNYRVTSGAGLGYRIFMRPTLKWAVEAGPGVRIDGFEDSGNVKVMPAVRAFSDFSWDFSEFASFLHNVEAIQDGGLTVDTTAALVARITERVSGQVSYQFRLNTDAPTGNEEIDTTTRLSLVYDF